MKKLIIDKEHPKGILVDMTPEEIAELEAFVDKAQENLKPTVEEQIAELKDNIENLKELFTPLLKMMGGNKD